MKKQFFTLVMTLVVLSLMLVVNSCKKDVPVDPTDNGPMLMNSQIIPEDVMPAFDADQVTVYGNIENDITCYPNLVVTDPRSAVTDRMGPGFKVIDIIKRMKLNDRQLSAIRGFMTDYHACVKDVMARTEAQRQAAMARARAAREDVIALYKSGEIDRATAARRIAEINKGLREALDKLINRDALCECLKALYRQIRSTLTTDEQKSMWDKWVAAQKLPCLTSVRTTP